MKLMSNWGFSLESWKGERGEYLLLMQAVLMIGFVLLPVYRPEGLMVLPPVRYGLWAIALLLCLPATFVMIKALLDLGANLTPLPYPKQDGQLVQTGLYGIVRHPLYSGILLAELGYAIGQLSLSHLAAVLALSVLLNYKASREEAWLSDRHPDYAAYQQRVKKLIPLIF
ncbi:MAG TPA: isoprenylcysteine carboxylmethyltransferase family protein [Coleofasciculaceae cyanobacterium]|jgi:protein-S-isoprenylcysteine O-methyltransferase Ste14